MMLNSKFSHAVKSRLFFGQLALLLPALLASNCQASPTSLTVLDSDFKLQGEYLGKVESDSSILGAQVIANGGGKFTVAFLMGGLPGLAVESSTRVEQTGTLLSNAVQIKVSDSTKEFVGSISADGEWLLGKTPQGKNFSLKKILRKSPTLGQLPPSNATTIFNGVDLTAFTSGSATRSDSLLLPVGSASSGATTIIKFGDFTLHMEFLVPFMPTSSGLARGNSGVYLQGRYELQILDSFGLNIFLANGTGANQECGSFFQLVKPKLNMSFPPLSWQTYDVAFTAAKFDASGKTLIEPAVVTIRLNGVVIHDQQKLVSNTLLGDAVTVEPGPLRFQAHGDPVYYRNIWVIENVATGVKPVLKKRVGVSQRKTRTSLSVANGRYTRKAASGGVYLNEE